MRMKDKEGKRSHRQRPGCCRGQAGTTVWGPEARQGWGGAGASGQEVSGRRNGVESADSPGTHSLDELLLQPQPCWVNPTWQGQECHRHQVCRAQGSIRPSHMCQVHACLSMCFHPGPSAPQTLQGGGGPGFSHPGKGLCVPPGTTGQAPTGPAPYWALKTPGGSGLVPISVLSPIYPKLVHSTSQIPLSVQSAPLHSSPIHRQCLALQSLPDKAESLQTWLDPNRPGSLS